MKMQFLRKTFWRPTPPAGRANPVERSQTESNHTASHPHKWLKKNAVKTSFTQSLATDSLDEILEFNRERPSQSSTC
jgi:hypothetical protein